MGLVVKSLKSDLVKPFSQILKAKVIENAQDIRFYLGGTFRLNNGVIVQDQVLYTSEIDSNFIDKNNIFSVTVGQEITVFVQDIKKIGGLEAAGLFTSSPFLFDLSDFIYLPSVFSIRMNGTTFKNIQLLSEKVSPSQFPTLVLTSTKFVDSTQNTEINQDLSFLDDFENLSSVNLTGSNVLGKMRLDNKPRLKSLNLSKCLLSTEDLDDIVQKLYALGNFFTGSGKSLNITDQRTGSKLSGVLGDPVSSGTGQGFATGLTDDFGWIVRQ